MPEPIRTRSFALFATTGASPRPGARFRARLDRPRSMAASLAVASIASVVSVALLLGAPASAIAQNPLLDPTRRAGSGPGQGETEGGSGAAPVERGAAAGLPTTEAVAETLAKVREELAAARRAVAAATTDGREAPPSAVSEVSLLERTTLVLEQQQAQFVRADELRQTEERTAAELATLRTAGPVEERPDSFLLLESVRDELAGHRSRRERLAATLSAAQKALEEAETRAADRERQRRLALEASETNEDAAATAEKAVALRLAELESRLARQTVVLREIELANQEILLRIHELRETLLTEKLAWIEARARFTEEDLEDELARLDREEFEARRSLESARLDLDAASRRLSAARLRRDGAGEPSQALAEEVEAVRLARERFQREVTLLGEKVERLALEREAWNRRYRVINELAEKAELVTFQEETRGWLEALERTARLQKDETDELRRDVVTLEEKAQAIRESDPDAARWVREQVRESQALIRVWEASTSSVEGAIRLARKLLADIEGRYDSQTLGERIARVLETVRGVWTYELTHVEDRPITVRKIVVGILLVILGFVFSRIVTSMLGRRLLPRLGLNEGAAAAIQSLAFYSLLVSFALLALRVVNVPLTAFTIAGGALAIGIGFGSQTLMNNFISGLILLVERPVRVGDLIELPDTLGVVMRVGARSTQIRTPSNVDYIVPNSAFLEKNVVNWTLSDDRYRTKVVVGVAYGSPTREVARFIRKAVDEHGKVLDKPEPIVLFSDFGDSALIFEVHFWLQMRRLMDARMVESDIRHRIDGLFREAGITIAFPQRDVHLDAPDPIDVRIVRSERGDG